MDSTKASYKPGFLFIFLLFCILPLCAETSHDEETQPADESSIIEESPHAEDPIIEGDALIVDDQIAFEGELPVESDDEENDYLFLFEAPPLVIEASPAIETRSFDDIFPKLTRIQRRLAMSPSGIRHSFERDEAPVLFPAPDSGV